MEGEELMHTANKSIWHTWRIGGVSFKQDRRVLPVLLLLLSIGIAVLILSVSYGEYEISPLDVLRTLLSIDTGDSRHQLVVFTFRLPRILVAFFVGAALSTSGAILQGITRNPLADPGILGVTSGASLVAVAAIVWFDVPLEWLPIATFVGALLMALAIFALAWKGGSAPVRLILVGVGLGAVATALTNLMLVFGEINAVQEASVWLAGSVYGSNWQHVHTIALWLAVLLTLAVLMARQLNTLNLGDDIARGLGVRVEVQRVVLLGISVALAAVSVSVAGTIGFVGLVAPHIARRLVGPSHEGLILVAALLGGVLLMLADLIGRWVISPSELPVGVVAAMIGAPYFAYLLYQTRNQ
ncbi:MAG: iron ABC transporter permease [Anaerolineaceae bacterium]|nr:iron ABC transporter permease [Anaerolineaceae bacterium]